MNTTIAQLRHLTLLGVLCVCGHQYVAAADTPLLPILNEKSGISIELSGVNGVDWAVETTSHLATLADTIIYTQPDVQFTLAHNERNMYMARKKVLVLGANGPDGTPDTTDDGVIRYVIDRDYYCHDYVNKVAPCVIDYKKSFSFARLTYETGRKVFGAFGSDDGEWKRPRYSKKSFWGVRGPFGNEWHAIKYWDDDSAIYGLYPDKKNKPQSHDYRERASDGNFVAVCVAPQTAIIQLTAPIDADTDTGTGAEFYTSPAKNYFIPKIWQQRSYMTADVLIKFVNITNAETIFYRLDGGAWAAYAGAFAAKSLALQDNVLSLLEVKIGETGTVLSREIMVNPDYPAQAEKHGFMLWSDERELQAIVTKIATTEPFKSSYKIFKGTYYQEMTANPQTPISSLRGRFGGGGAACVQMLSNVFVCTVEGIDAALPYAQLAKQRLLHQSRLHPVGLEVSVTHAKPVADYINSLGQFSQKWGFYGLSYDMLSARFRASDHPDGMTPIEEIIIREGLAKCAHGLLRLRENYSIHSGAGDTHWAHGMETAIGLIALSMPTYSTPWYGVSGGDFTSKNTYKDAKGQYYNPYPDQAVTWYECVTDPRIEVLGHPNVGAPFRSEFIYADDGFWSGPNNLQGDGNRYYKGPVRRALVDMKHGGMVNADCRVELIEMGGYEAPFVEITNAFHVVRKIKQDPMAQAFGLTSYINRRLVNGYSLLSYDKKTEQYTRQPAFAHRSLTAFNRYYPVAQHADLVRKHLADLALYYTDKKSLDKQTVKRLGKQRKSLYTVLGLALCDDPRNIQKTDSQEMHVKPYLKTLFKYVVKPGVELKKELITYDLAQGQIELPVVDLPDGATFDTQTSTIRWTPSKKDGGVHIVTVHAKNAHGTTTRQFPIIVRIAPFVLIPKPSKMTAVYDQASNSVRLAWGDQEPKGRKQVDAEIAAYTIYRDGLAWHTVAGDVMHFTDSESIVSGMNTRYNVSAISIDGSESAAAEPQIVVTAIP